MRIRSRRAFSASDSSPASGTRARASISLNGSPPFTGAAHRSSTSTSSSRERKKATSSPSGDRLTPLATGPASDGLAKTRSTVRIEDAGAVAAGGDAGCGLDWAKAEVAAIRIVEARRNVRMTAKLEADSSAVIRKSARLRRPRAFRIRPRPPS
ncbi:hypothetical protein D3C72_1498840 [compost metagenome]